MWKVEYRDMTPEEREELQDLLGDCSRSGLGTLGALSGALTALTVALVATAHPAFLLVAVVLGGIAGGLAVRACSSRATLRAALWRDLRGGKVQVIQVAPHDVIRLTGPHGDVAGWFAGMGDGHHMFIEPREWEHPGEGAGFDRLFPCSRFSIVRAPRSRIDLDFRCDGDRIPTLRDIPVASGRLLDGWVEDGDVLFAGVDALERRLNSARR